jgi:uncharacterized protein (DUF58 family)
MSAITAEKAESTAMDEQPRWQPTMTLRVTLGFCVAVFILAVLRRREDFLLLATPLMISMTVALSRRPRGTSRVSLQAPKASLLEDQVVDVRVRVDSDEGIDLVCVRLDSTRWLEPVLGRPERVTSVQPGGAGEVVVRLRSIRWGRQTAGPAVVDLVGAHGLLRSGPLVSGTAQTSTLPLRDVFEATDAVPRAAGMVGLHRSRRPGEGTDIAGVRPFVPGDKLRRINWPVSLRAGELHVTATMSDRDTDVILVLDTHFDLGISGGVDGSSSSLDMTVRAAASIAEHYLRHGDRVGLIDITQAVRQVRPAAGRSHLIKLLDVLLDVAPAGRGGIGATMALTSISGGALVLVLSPLVGDNALNRIAAIARSGHTVLVIDTLPEDAQPPRRSEWTEVAYRVWHIERSADIGRLGELGIPVVPWRGAGSLDEVLRDLSRAAMAPKALR